MLLALCALTTAAANLPALQLLPRLSALTSDDAPEPVEPMPYTAVSLLTTHGAGLLNALLGTSINAASDEAALCADVSAPAGPGAPSIVLLASPQGNPAEGATPVLAPLPLAVLAAADVWVAVFPASADEQALDSFLDSLVQRVARLAETQHACGGGREAQQVREEERGPGRRQHRHHLLLIFSTQTAEPRPDEDGTAAAAAAAAAAVPQRACQRLAALWAERRAAGASASGRDELNELLEVSVASVPPPSEAASFQAAGSALLARFVQPSHEVRLPTIAPSNQLSRCSHTRTDCLAGWLAGGLTDSLTHLLSHSPAHSLTCSLTHPLTHAPTLSLSCSLTHLLSHSAALSLTHSHTQLLSHRTRATSSSTHGCYTSRPCRSPSCRSCWKS